MDNSIATAISALEPVTNHTEFNGLNVEGVTRLKPSTYWPKSNG